MLIKNILKIAFEIFKENYDDKYLFDFYQSLNFLFYHNFTENGLEMKAYIEYTEESILNSNLHLFQDEILDLEKYVKQYADNPNYRRIDNKHFFNTFYKNFSS